MQGSSLLFLGAFLAINVQIEAQSLSDTIVTKDKAIGVVNQSLSGMWLSQLRRPGPTGLQAPIPTFTTFFSDGTSLASPSDGTQTATHGLWVRVGDRKFLGTGYFFSFDANRVLTTITKIRINYQLSIDGQSLTGTTEAVIMEPTGRILNTLPGAQFSMIRLSPEIAGDFYEFQKLQ